MIKYRPLIVLLVGFVGTIAMSMVVLFTAQRPVAAENCFPVAVTPYLSGGKINGVGDGICSPDPGTGFVTADLVLVGHGTVATATDSGTTPLQATASITCANGQYYTSVTSTWGSKKSSTATITCSAAGSRARLIR